MNKNDRRQSVDVVELAASPALLVELERQRLVRKEPRLDSFYFEISHDTWLPPVLKNRKRRQELAEAERRERELLEAKAKQRRVRRAAIFSISLATAAVLASIFAFLKWQEAKRNAHKAETLLEASRWLAARKMPPDLEVFFYNDTLNFSRWRIDCLPIKIGKLQKLQSLDLGANNLTSLPIEVFAKMPNLKKIILKNFYGGNPLPSSEVEALRQAMPWCEIIWED